MGLFDKSPYSTKNLLRGVMAARANGEPYNGYKYAIAFQQEEDDRQGRRWSKQKMSYDRDTDTVQTDNFIGYAGEKGQKRKVHIAVTDEGDVVFVRDFDGTILYDKKHGVGRLPDNLDWSK
ncbi:hypothetical protein [Arthrobacter roseus]|uniref:hypothetical protein n=1 Tax=Arthrobacter roseus TaxID=136274 RepID=UPI0019653C11|nr:hypothetical protein [Arthrobacter roseus]MBM7849601.1 hypothetical protein [Arthrobacter roseus]